MLSVDDMTLVGDAMVACFVLAACDSFEEATIAYLMHSGTQKNKDLDLWIFSQCSMCFIFFRGFVKLPFLS